MQIKNEALENNETWVVEKLLPRKKELGCKWIYKIKYYFDGSMEWFKERLVIFDKYQKEKIDYKEILYPDVKMVTV